MFVKPNSFYQFYYLKDDVKQSLKLLKEQVKDKFDFLSYVYPKYTKKLDRLEWVMNSLLDDFDKLEFFYFSSKDKLTVKIDNGKTFIYARIINDKLVDISYWFNQSGEKENLYLGEQFYYSVKAVDCYFDLDKIINNFVNVLKPLRELNIANKLDIKTDSKDNSSNSPKNKPHWEMFLRPHPKKLHEVYDSLKAKSIREVVTWDIVCEDTFSKEDYLKWREQYRPPYEQEIKGFISRDEFDKDIFLTKIALYLFNLKQKHPYKDAVIVTIYNSIVYLAKNRDKYYLKSELTNRGKGISYAFMTNQDCPVYLQFNPEKKRFYLEVDYHKDIIKDSNVSKVFIDVIGETVSYSEKSICKTDYLRNKMVFNHPSFKRDLTKHVIELLDELKDHVYRI